MRLDEIKYSLRNLLHRKMRTWLMMLSILLGVMTIYTLVSFGLGIQNYVNQIAEEAGTDKLFIQAKGAGAPGTDENFFITEEEVNFVSKIRGVDEIIGMYAKAIEIEHNDVKRFNFGVGFDVENIDLVEQVFTVGVGRGRQLKKGDLDKVVLGFNYQLDDKIFKNGLTLGDKVRLNSKIFEVVGFYEEVGNPADDANIYLTDDAFLTLYPDTKDRFGWVMVKANKQENPALLAEKIQDKLRKFKGQDKGKEDFFVQTLEDAFATFGVIINVINAVLFLIALISVVVASINITNTMYTAVLERRKEIGVMKAIGARNSDILFIFVFESGFLGVVGGLVGVGIGYLIASTGGRIAAAAGFASLQPIFPWFLTVGSLLFSFAVGAFAGILPALNAAKLNPVDSLRYE